MTTTATKPAWAHIRARLLQPRPEAAYTLAFFRVGFGVLMCYSLLRFALKGWIYELYIQPQIYFPFYGFEWIKPLPGMGMYVVFALLFLLAACIAVGKFYRPATAAFFLLFTYVELIDKTNYLNHYYFISLISFLMIFLPADAVCSLDARSRKNTPTVYTWHRAALLLQIGSVYFFASIAKIKPDWLLHAQPLGIWLHANNNLPLIGPLFDYKITAYAASWFGMLFDISLPFFLLYKRTRIWAYLTAIFFHVFTGMLFHIGMFPYIMIFSALVFFPSEMHRKWLMPFFRQQAGGNRQEQTIEQKNGRKTEQILLLFFFAIQLFMPFRYLLYPGNPFLGEEGFRFSWNVMLMEKTGTCEFLVVNREKQIVKTVYPHELLSKQQEHMMSTQPDMVLQFAHMLADREKAVGNLHPEVYAVCYTSVNGRSSRLLIDPKTDLSKEHDNFYHKPWILSDAK